MKKLFLSGICIFTGLIFIILGITFRSSFGSFPFIALIGAIAALLIWGKGMRSRVSSSLLQYNIIVSLSALAFITLCGYFVITRSLFHDNSSSYSLFHDNLQSLNYFGEPAWWFPNNQFGFPGYFYSILGNMNCAGPVFVAMSFIFWMLGRMGIYITNIVPVYIWYFGAIVPFIFLLSVWFFARQILKSSAAVIYVCIVSAFSPGVLLNFSDVGILESAAYGLFFAASYLNFIKNPGKKSFLILVLFLAICAVSLNYAFLIWNVLFIAALLLTTLFPGESLNQVRDAVRSVPLKKWILAMALVLLCAMPSVITMKQGAGNIARTTIADNKSEYAFLSFSPGNPLLPLLASTPGIGYTSKTSENEKTQYSVLCPAVVGNGFLGYIYLGLLSLPLALWGFLYSRSYWKIRFFILFVIFFSIVVLVNFSPLFLSLLFLHTPLNVISHFSDLIDRGGGFMLMVFAAGLGLEALMDRRPENRFFIVVFLISVFLSAVFLILSSHNSILIFGVIFGFMLLMALSFFIVFSWLMNTKQNYFIRNVFFGLILFLTLIDMSTFSHLHVRTVMLPSFGRSTLLRDAADFDIQRPDKIGVISSVANFQADTTLTLKSLFNLNKKGFPVKMLPQYALFTHAHISNDISEKDFEDVNGGRSLALGGETARTRYFLHVRPLRQNIAAGSIVSYKRTYNSLRLQVGADRPVLLFVRDSYSPYWKAKINGKDTPVIKAFGNFKAVVVPRGLSEVIFKYDPPGIALSILLAYIVIIFIAILCLREIFKLNPENV